jgi:hypothetical protein
MGQHRPTIVIVVAAVGRVVVRVRRIWLVRLVEVGIMVLLGVNGVVGPVIVRVVAGEVLN